MKGNGFRQVEFGTAIDSAVSKDPSSGRVVAKSEVRAYFRPVSFAVMPKRLAACPISNGAPEGDGPSGHGLRCQWSASQPVAFRGRAAIW